MSLLNPSHTLTVTSEAIPDFLGAPLLEAVRLSGHEGLNSLFHYELTMKTPDALNLGASQAADIDLDGFIGREICVRIQLDGSGSFAPGRVGAATDHVGAGVREINAIISAAACLGEEGPHIQYKLILEPWLHLARQTSNCLTFQNMTVVEILDEVLGAYAFPVEKRLIEKYEVRDTQTQFNESDFEFFERITQFWGINYFFCHSEGHHRLVLIDNNGAFEKAPSESYQEIVYHPPGWKTDAEYISSVVPHNRLTAGRFTTRDYDYTRPRADLTASRTDPRPTGHNTAEVYQYHSRTGSSNYAQPRAGTAPANDPHAEGDFLARVRMETLRTDGARAKASGNLRGVVPGHTFFLQGHPRQQANIEYLPIDTWFLIEDVAQVSQIKDAAALRKQSWRVEVTFTAHPMSVVLRPALTQPKPLIHGPQSAVVVGPAGQNLWTDEYARIKVQFPWDRIGEKNERSSCWVRVSKPWAGNQLGEMYIPRIGQEVVIQFYGGDPDLPICMAGVYNQSNMPPWKLPGQSAISGIRSRELTDEGGNSAAGRSNQLLMDDTKDGIQVQVKSDHQHSALSLGAITRIEDNTGRQDARGEGFELGTGGSGALRAAKGLLLTTDGRHQAVGGILSRDELVVCLEEALSLAKSLGKAAVECQGAPRETQPQQDLSHAIDALGHGANNEANAKGKAAGGQPVLAMSGAAGIASATPRDHTQFAGQNIDTVAARNQQHYAGQSILQSAGKDIEQFSTGGDIRSIANHGKVIVQAQHNSVEVTGEQTIDIRSLKEGVTVFGEPATL